MMRSLHRQSSGSVLIVVLCVSIGLVAVTLMFGHGMLMNYRAADNDIAGRQAEQAIDGAVRYVETLLANAETPGLLPAVTAYQNEDVSVGEATFWILGRPADSGATTTREFGLVDEAGKLNLNSATKRMLRSLPGMNDDLEAAIEEWRKAATAGGNSATTASSTSKQGPFESIEELALVPGATREILYGEDANMNGTLDTNEDDGDKTLPTDNSDGKLDPGILEYVTAFSRESNKQTDGSTNRINIADLARASSQLTTLLDSKLGTGRAAKILPLAAQGGPLRSVIDFYMRSRSEMTADEFGKVAYEMTISDPQTEPYLTGLVNVNTASETVLASIPGFDSSTAATLISARLSRSPLDTNYAWIVDALGGQANDVINAGGRYLTGRSFQVTADIAAVGRLGRGYRREKVVIDTSTGTPQIVYRRNLAPLGWALGSDVRETLAQRKESR